MLKNVRLIVCLNFNCVHNKKKTFLGKLYKIEKNVTRVSTMTCQKNLFCFTKKNFL